MEDKALKENVYWWMISITEDVDRWITDGHQPDIDSLIELSGALAQVKNALKEHFDQ